MQIALSFLKRKQICPILAYNNWQYEKLSKEESVFQECMLEVMGWYARRGTRLSPTVLYTVLEQMLLKKEINPTESDIIDAVKHFTQTNIYKKINQPLLNTDIQLKIGNRVIVYEAPIIAKYEDSYYIMMFDQTITDADLLSRSLEARFISIWAFYILNTYPNIYNFVKKANKVEPISIKVKQDYIRESKKVILNMEYLSYNNNHPAHHLVCRNCSWRNECPMTIMKERTKVK